MLFTFQSVQNIKTEVKHQDPAVALILKQLNIQEKLLRVLVEKLTQQTAATNNGPASTPTTSADVVQSSRRTPTQGRERSKPQETDNEKPERPCKLLITYNITDDVAVQNFLILQIF